MDKMKEIYDAFFQKTPQITKKALTKNDYEFMNSLSSAILYTRPKKLHWVLIAFLITIIFFLIWASVAKIDEIARGSGKVVPNGQNQIVQNLEGGIVSEILIKEGDLVEKDQILIKISNEKSNSTVASNELKALYLQAQIKRLESELKRENFTYEISDNQQLNDFLSNENELFITDKKQLESKIMILKEQIKQKENEEIETEKQLVRESATKKKESLLKAFSTNADLVSLTENRFTKFINELDSVKDITAFHKNKALQILEQELRNKFKDTITVKVVDIQNELLSKVKDKADSENISKEISHRFHEIVGQIEGEEKLDNINLYIQTALSEQKQFVSAIEGKAPKKQRVSITKPNVKAKINIETEEEVIAYIGEMEKEMNDLKEKMLNAIKESKIVDVK